MLNEIFGGSLSLIKIIFIEITFMVKVRLDLRVIYVWKPPIGEAISRLGSFDNFTTLFHSAYLEDAIANPIWVLTQAYEAVMRFVTYYEYK